MGYYTDYNLDIQDSEGRTDYELLEEVIKAFDLPLEDDGSTYESCKWYSHNEDLEGISEKYPDKLFILKGEGEESNDLWEAYYKNGKSVKYRAKIVFDKFKEEDLK